MRQPTRWVAVLGAQGTGVAELADQLRSALAAHPAHRASPGWAVCTFTEPAPHHDLALLMGLPPSRPRPLHRAPHRAPHRVHPPGAAPAPAQPETRPEPLAKAVGEGLPPSSDPDAACNTDPVTPETPETQDIRLREQLHALGLPYCVIEGTGPARLPAALLALGLPTPDAPAQHTREQAQFHLNQGRTPWTCERCSDPDCEHPLFTRLLQRPDA